PKVISRRMSLAVPDSVVRAAGHHITSFSLLFASRNADDPEVGLQQQLQLHRPPHFRLYALPAEDGERAPEPTTQPRSC
ncbi:MAG: hypothetical protein ACRCWR_01610, partial [Saezia sp.]